MTGRESAATLAPMFRYPERMPAANAARELAAFFEEVAPLDLRSLQSAYTMAFDLSPVCSPYLGDHVFGDEHRNRARLMVGLRLRYGSNPAELSDHIAEVLAFADRFNDEEWSELRRLVLEPALRKMTTALEATSSPYRHLVSAAARMLEEPQS